MNKEVDAIVQNFETDFLKVKRKVQEYAYKKSMHLATVYGFSMLAVNASPEDWEYFNKKVDLLITEYKRSQE